MSNFNIQNLQNRKFDCFKFGLEYYLCIIFPRRSLVDARARASQRGRQHWTAAFPLLEVWILARPVLASSSGPTSEISSQAGEGDFEDNWLVSTPSSAGLVSASSKWVNMASGTATTAPSTATTAPSTAPTPLIAGPSTMESIIPANLGAQDTPSVNQGAQDTPRVTQRAMPVVSTEQTMQSTSGYGTLPYCRIRHPCRLQHPCRMLPCLLC